MFFLPCPPQPQRDDALYSCRPRALSPFVWLSFDELDCSCWLLAHFIDFDVHFPFTKRSF